MSTELAVPTDAPQVIERRPRGLALATLEEFFDFADVLHKSGLAPASFRSVESIVVALTMGAELGFAPNQSLQNIGVIKGKAGVYGDGLPALVMASGLCLDLGEWWELNGEEVAGPGNWPNLKDWPDDFAACAVTQRKGRSRARSARFTVADARRAGLWGNTGPWSTSPLRMLRFRNLGFILRDEYPDVLRGFKSYEELRDYPDDEPRHTPPPRPKTVKAEVLPAPPTATEDEARAQAVEEMRQVLAGKTKPADASLSALKAAANHILKNEPDHALKDAIFEDAKRRKDADAEAKAEEERRAQAEEKDEKPKPKRRSKHESPMSDAVHEAITTARESTPEEKAEYERVFGQGGATEAAEAPAEAEDVQEAVIVAEASEAPAAAPRLPAQQPQRMYFEVLQRRGIDVGNYDDVMTITNAGLSLDGFGLHADLSTITDKEIFDLTKKFEKGDLDPAALLKSAED